MTRYFSFRRRPSAPRSASSAAMLLAPAYLLALPRALALILLSAVGAFVASVTILLLALVVPYPLLVAVVRRLAQLGRRLARDWCGVEIRAGYAPPPAPPQRRADGWYAYENQLYRSPWWPTFMAKLTAYSKDHTYTRDWMWLALGPVGAAIVAVPLGLVAGGVAVLAGVLEVPRSVPIGLVLVLAGLAAGPWTLRRYGWWSRLTLGPLDESWWRTSGFGPWVGRAVKATWHGGGLAGLGLAAQAILALHLAATAMTWLFPFVVNFTRPYFEYYRRKAAQWTGQAYPLPYRPLPEPPQPDESGRYRAGRTLYATRASAERAARYTLAFSDPASWRDLLWMVTNAPISLLGFVPAVLFSVGFYGLVCQPLWWAAWAVPVGLASGYWVPPWFVWYAVSLGWPALEPMPGWMGPVIGAVMAIIGLLLAGPLLRLRTRYDQSLLNPTRSTLLAQRVARLTETRADAVDVQAAELRRIERDLHDGAQARLVAVGLGLATVEALIEQDPEAARALLAQARETSATALQELPDLVRGIHPPVLAERGLADAVRAIALDSPLDVQVSVDLPERPEPPVESAAYFATVEALANASRHARATHVDVDIRHTGGALRITVTDDGQGGADPSRGTGLRGIERRLGTFDGVLRVTSPAGGPTTISMEIPCALSSPRTSTSSGTA